MRIALAHPYLAKALTVLDNPNLLIDLRYDKSWGVGDALGLNWTYRSYLSSINLQ